LNGKKAIKAPKERHYCRIEPLKSNKSPEGAVL